MPIERQTEGALKLEPVKGKGPAPTAMVRWVVGRNKLSILQDDSHIELTGEQFKEFMENSMDIYKDMVEGLKQ